MSARNLAKQWLEKNNPQLIPDKFVDSKYYF